MKQNETNFQMRGKTEVEDSDRESSLDGVRGGQIKDDIKNRRPKDDELAAVKADLYARAPELEPIRSEIDFAFRLMTGSFRDGGTLLVCGNGGSAADSEHIVGELMKGFRMKRPIPSRDVKKLELLAAEEGREIASKLQEALPAISLTSHPSLRSAVSNDTGQEMEFAQQVYGYGTEGDCLVGISTSGNSANVVKAMITGKALGLITIGLTGEKGGRLAELCDCTIRAPSSTVHIVQEYHMQIYHTLCAMIEREFFSV
jgi:D-sedoheptulose 7-phosphate isomerase